MVAILAIDPSLTRTGICFTSFADGGPVIECVPTGNQRGMARIEHIISQLRIDGYDLVVIEGSMMAARVSPETMWLHGIMRWELRHIPQVEIAPASRQKWACGSQKDRSKEAVLLAAARHGFFVENNDEADAAWLWHIAHTAYHGTATDLPQYRREVLGNIAWPQLGGTVIDWPKVRPARKKAAAA